MNVKKLTRLAMLTTIALIIFMVEAQIPPPIPIPGIKLGLANIVTVYAMFALSPWDTLSILVCRVFLGSVFSGQPMTLFYSMGGGLLCWLAMLLLRRVLTKKQLWAAGVFGAVFHNIGQILVAIALTRTPGLIAYLPVLLVSGILTGAFTGLCAQFLLARLDKLGQQQDPAA
ncbi:MAG: Gx transporter family protein [Oscillospiraceae bacterium]|jgi:heptaprenyl diphosphate synthase|nr:Gx transporter family protein [Oscillospiraceae bacterium]